jgi:hypothetical protein
MIEQITIGFLIISIVRQVFVNDSLRRQIWQNEVELYTLAAQCRGLAQELGYTITTPSLEKHDGVSRSTTAV